MVCPKRLAESWIAWLLGFYRNYRQFTTHTWNFQQVCPTTSHEVEASSLHWVAVFTASKAKYERDKKKKLRNKKVVVIASRCPLLAR